MGVGRWALWAGAGLFALVAHAGAVAWALREPPIEMADHAPSAAIMIELAAEPETINTETNEIAEQAENSPEVKSETVQRSEEIVEKSMPGEVQSEQPAEEVAEAEREPVDSGTTDPTPEAIEPLDEQVMHRLENVEVPIPLSRPRTLDEKPPEKPRPKKQEVVKKPAPKKPAPSSEASTKASAQVRQSNRNAATQTAAGTGFGSVSPAKWQSRLMAHLERRKRYPSGARSRKEQGTAYVRFRIDDSGNVLSASLDRSSGFPELDDEVLALVRRASPVPAPPPGVNKTITAPVRFTAR